MHGKFYLDTMSIQMLHKPSTDTHSCALTHTKAGLLLTGGCQSFLQTPRTPHAQSEQTPEHTGTVVFP